MAKIHEILALLNSIAPFDAAEEWDNVGLLAGSPEGETERVLCALDLSNYRFNRERECDKIER